MRFRRKSHIFEIVLIELPCSHSLIFAVLESTSTNFVLHAICNQSNQNTVMNYFLEFHVQKWLSLLSVLVLSLVTYVLTNHTDRFGNASQQILVGPGFEQWEVSGGGVVSGGRGGLKISNGVVTSTTVSQRVKVSQPGYYQLSLKAEVAIKGGQSYSDRASLVVIAGDGRNSGGILGRAFSLAGTSSMAPYEVDMYFSPEISSVDVEVRLLGSSGYVKITDLSLGELYQLPFHKAARYFLYFAWVCVSLFSLKLLFCMLELKLFTVVLVMFGALGIGVFMPAGNWAALSLSVREVIPSGVLENIVDVMGIFYEINGRDPAVLISKFVHALAFLLVGFLGVILVGEKAGVTFILAAIICLAISSEILQLLTLQRTSSFDDLQVDILFGLFGVAIAWSAVILLRAGGRMLR